ncbi:hypothetical protein J2067_003974 [Erwinia rhapontici]|nr:hypothetical protein [Erwinia rhapontici]
MVIRESEPAFEDVFNSINMTRSPWGKKRSGNLSGKNDDEINSQ